MKRETEKPLDERQRIVAYLAGLQAKVNALRERTPTAGGTPSSVLREGRRGFNAVRAG